MTAAQTTDLAPDRSRVHNPAPASAPFPSRYLAVEFRRVLRNPRRLIFACALPVVLFLVFGASQTYSTETLAHGNVMAVIMVSISMYGAVVATTTAGASVSLETAQGWMRTLNLTPLRPSSYVLVKLAAGMLVGLLPILLITIVGAFTGAAIDGAGWVLAPLLAWLGASIFVIFGLAVGLFFPSENVMQIMGMVLTLLAFAGNVMIPLSGTMLTIAKFTPMYGISMLARWPITGEGLDATTVANIVAWTAIFAAAAMRRYRAATARV